MIIEPDFLDHWKTRLLIRLLDTEAAPTYVIRLWSHCQTRKTNRFQDWNPEILAAVCKWTGDAQQFWGAMMQTFCRQDNQDVIAHQWDEVNAGLIASWSNGGKGGRPKKPRGNPQVTHGLPTGYPAVNPDPDQVNPQVTHGVTDREEEIEKKGEKEAPKSPRHRFEKPSLQDVETRCIEIGLPLNEASKFINYYESKGWMVGKNHMKCWKSALSGWKQRRDENIQPAAIQQDGKRQIDWRDSL
jgi:hypothetical protein